MTEKTKAYVRNKKLRDLRKKLGITQDEIAEALEMTRSAYQHLEAKGNPSGDILFKISRYLGCEIEELIENVEFNPTLLRESDKSRAFTKTTLSDDEKKVLEMFDSLSPEDKARALGYLTGLSSKL